LTVLSVRTPAAEDLALEVIPLKHRTIEEVLPVLKPLMAPGGAITGMNDQLIVRTTPANLIEIEEVLSRIDKAPRSLRITVRQDIAGQETALGQGLSGTYRSDGTGSIDYRAYGTQGHSDDRNTHFIQVMEGQPAFIETGKSVPLPQQNVIISGGGAMVQNSLEYHDVTSGFDVIPTLNGNQVTLAITPSHSRMDPGGAGVIDRQAAQTTVTGKLGEWIELGGATENLHEDTNAYVHQTRRHGDAERRIWVKVEELGLAHGQD
jgi:hypothetical protein